MARWNSVLSATAVSKSALAVVVGPLDVSLLPRRVVTVVVASGSGKLGLADAAIQLGPTADGPWLDESLVASGIPTLAAGGAGVYRMDKGDHWMRVLAKGVNSTGQTDLSIYVDAIGDL